MEKIISLCKNYEFQRLYRRGKSSVRPSLVMYSAPNRAQGLRLGITVGKKLGGAVQRNRAKRRLRELFRLIRPSMKVGVDICVVARARVLTVPYEKLRAEFISAAEELGLLKADC